MIDLSGPIEQAKEAFVALGKTITEAARALSKTLSTIVDFHRLWEAYAKLLSPGKWWHLYKHAKRRRTRKKYYNKIRNLVSASIA